MRLKENRNDIKFSVVIPAYNAGDTIARAIDSVLAQSYPAFEIIVVDDASTDNTSEMLKDAYGTRVKSAQKINNGGGAVARNMGMDMATGDYIAFLDADDVWHPDKLMLIKTLFEAMPDVTLFYHPYTLDDISNKRLPEDIPVYQLPFIKLLPGNKIATPCVVIKNEPAFRFEPSMRYTEDYDLWLRIGYRHKLHFINIPLTRLFRPVLSKGGVSADKWKMRKGEMRAYRRLVKLNPLFLFLLPLLLLNSLGKHLYKAIIKTR